MHKHLSGSPAAAHELAPNSMDSDKGWTLRPARATLIDTTDKYQCIQMTVFSFSGSITVILHGACPPRVNQFQGSSDVARSTLTLTLRREEIG